MERIHFLIALALAMGIFFQTSVFLQAQETDIFDLGDTTAMSEEELKAAKALQSRLREYQRLIDVAKAAGFTDEELRQIKIEDEGETIYLVEFVEQAIAKMKADRQQKEEELKKRYITVKDITEDLIKKESGQVSILRDTLIFNGGEE